MSYFGCGGSAPSADYPLETPSHCTRPPHRSPRNRYYPHSLKSCFMSNLAKKTLPDLHLYVLFITFSVKGFANRRGRYNQLIRRLISLFSRASNTRQKRNVAPGWAGSHSKKLIWGVLISFLDKGLCLGEAETLLLSIATHVIEHAS